jgi:hypothetical protein
VQALSFAQPVVPPSGVPPSVLPPPVVFGWQTPFTHVVPDAQVPASSPQVPRHWLSAHTLPLAHWLVNWQVLVVLVHAPD